MQIIDNLLDAKALLNPVTPTHPPLDLDQGKGCVLSIGNFDGVHRGHQTLLSQLRQQTESLDLPMVVMTFEPHPRDFFASQINAPLMPRILRLEDKLDALAQAGVSIAFVLPFDQHLAALTADAFIQTVLVDTLKVRHILIGDDFRFGAKRQGDYTMLVQAGQQFGFTVERMNSHIWQGQRVSSTAIRHALKLGHMEEVRQLLGRPYVIRGEVQHGRQLGRQLFPASEVGLTGSAVQQGFRTLNIPFGHPHPAAQGIFISRVWGLLPDTWVSSVSSLGHRPSLDANDLHQGQMLLETHCLHWPNTLTLEEGYGKIIAVELLVKLHDEIQYDSFEALALGIAQDCLEAERYFSAQIQAII